MGGLGMLGLALQLMTSPQMSLATNNSTDLFGVIDTRPNTWGRAEAYTHKLVFTPPTGWRVRIVRVYGDVVSWPLGPQPDGTHAGVLFGLQTTAPDGSRGADLAGDNCMLYLQDVVVGGRSRIGFDHNVEVGGLLEKDNTLLLKVASWLNTTNLTIHMEPSLVIVYRWEKESK